MHEAAQEPYEGRKIKFSFWDLINYIIFLSDIHFRHKVTFHELTSPKVLKLEQNFASYFMNIFLRIAH